jgi:D-cysteine desulfhydrase
MQLPELADITKMNVQKLQPLSGNYWGVEIEVLRADLIHPVISGNKWFKLKHHLLAAMAEKRQGLLTFGGAYSNHIHAVSYAAKCLGLPSVIVVRGHAPKIHSPTLKDCLTFGSKIVYAGNASYRETDILTHDMKNKYPEYYVISEGGRSALGVKGAAEMLSHVNISGYSHICCAVGTGTMLAGLAQSSASDQQLVGIPVLKVSETNDENILPFILEHAENKNIQMAYGHHEGGYARHTDKLIAFMNEFYKQFLLPLDFVYTAKLFNAVFRLAETGYFPSGSRLLLIHSGGLQGNRSLPQAQLNYSNGTG